MLGRLEKVENKDRAATATTSYWRVAVVSGPERRQECLLLTESELSKIRYRAKRNPEDCALPPPTVPWLGWALIVAALAGIIALVWWT
jgi:hypothetical protein